MVRFSGQVLTRMLIALVMASALLCMAQGAYATTYNFVGGSPGHENSWFQPENWSPNGVPGASDTAIINKSTPGSITVRFSGTLTVASLYIINADSTLDGANDNGVAGTLNVTSAFNWSAGTVQDTTVIIPTGAQLNITGNASKTIGDKCRLYNAGTATWTGNGSIVLFEEAAGGALVNSGTLNIQTNASIDNPRFQFGVCSVTNSGTITKSVATGLTKFNHVRFNSSGTININTGSLELHGLITTSGPLNLASNTFLNFADGTSRFKTGTLFNGAGTFRLFNSEALANGGTGSANVSMSGTINLSGNFEIPTGTVGSDGLYIRDTGDTLTLNGDGNFNWKAGNIILGNLNIGSNLHWNISGNANKSISQTIVNNAGTVTWTGAGNIYPDGTFNNSGAFNVQTDADIGGFNSSLVFNNSGTFVKSASNGVTQLGLGQDSITLNNSGTVYVNSGTLQLSAHGGGTMSGLFATTSGTTLQFNGESSARPFVLNSGTTFSGAGLVRVAFPGQGVVMSGAPTVNCAFEIDGQLQNQSSNTTLSLSGSGPINWRGGEINGILNIAAGTLLNISGSDNKGLACILNNAGNASWSSGFIVGESGTINNTGVFDVTGDVQLGTGFNAATINNSGTFLKSAGTGTANIGVGTAFNNSGTVVSRSGTLNFQNTFTQTAGVTMLDGGNLASPNPLILKGGYLIGSGTMTGSINNSGATISPGSHNTPQNPNASIGAIHVLGDYTQGANGKLALEINGAVISLRDAFDASGVVTLAGSLDATVGFTPAIGTELNVLSDTGNTAIGGIFTGLPQDSIILLNNVLFQISYIGGDGNDVTLTRIAAPTISISDLTITEGTGIDKNANFTVTLSFASPQTISVSAIPANGTAKAPADYTANGATLTFNPGQTTKTFSVPVIGDSLDEDDETFFALLSSPSNASILRGRGTCTIADNDSAPSITIDDLDIGEGNNGQRTATFQLHLSSPSGKLVKVNYATAAGTATPNNDYDTVASTQIAFTTGQTVILARVLLNGDTLNEPDETFKVNLTSPVNATIADNQAIGTILNDDTAPSLSIDDVSISEGDSGTKTLTFTVNLSAPSGQTVTVNYATADGVARSTSDYVAQNSNLSFAPGVLTQTINVIVNGDTVVEGNETLFVLLSGAVNASISKARGTGTINNDDGSG